MSLVREPAEPLTHVVFERHGILCSFGEHPIGLEGLLCVLRPFEIVLICSARAICWAT